MKVAHIPAVVLLLVTSGCGDRVPLGGPPDGGTTAASATTGGTAGSGATAGSGGTTTSGTGGAGGGGIDRGDARCDQVSYASDGFYGPNVLYPSRTSFTDQPYSMPYEIEAEIKSGSVIIEMTRLSPTDYSPPSDLWSTSAAAWLVTNFDPSTQKQTFKAQNSGTWETPMWFAGSGQARVDYFECGSATPTFTKVITWSPPPDASSP
jgi:hypothetical protein